GILQVSQMGGYRDFFAPRFGYPDTQHMFGKPRRRARRPPMAEAVSETDVAIIAIVAMDIFFPGRHQFIYTSRIGQPIEVKVFPKGGCPQIEHSSPILADYIHCPL